MTLKLTLQMKKVLVLLFILITFKSFSQSISTNGNTFSPDTIYAYLGDTITFNLSSSHNAVEVDETTFLNNDSTSNGGFNIPFGGGELVLDSIKTYYYVCQPHANMGMKGVIISSEAPCNKSIEQSLKGFNPNPLYGPWQWSYDTLSLVNTSNCDIRVSPEFDIYHENSAISSNDFDLKWYNPILGNWPSLTYYIDANGHAVGFWSAGGAADTMGIVISQGSTQQIIIRVRFKPSANYGTYYASWKTNELDNNGDFIQNLDNDSTQIELVDCSIFQVDSVYSSNVSCFNNSDGYAEIVSIQNGSGQYNYLWSNGDTTNITSNLAADSFYCIISDSNWPQCSDSINVFISQPSELIVNENTSHITCYNDSTGSINLFISGGTNPYNENWDVTSTTNLSQGIYSYTVTDLNGCTVSDTVEIFEPDQLIFNTSTQDVNCYDGNDGTADINISSGGNPPFNYLWSNGQTTSSITNLSAGNYNYTITYNGSCDTTGSITINQPDQLTSNFSFNNVSCFGEDDGSAFVNFFGGTTGSVQGDTNYVLGWAGLSTILYYPLTTFNTADVAPSGVPAGIYPYSVTDLNGCIHLDTITITQPDSLYFSYSMLNYNGYEISCSGFNDGLIEINIFGGTGPYTNYLENIASNIPLDSFTLSGISSGIYIDSIIDINGCKYIDTFILDEPPALNLNLNQINVLCNAGCDGSILSNVTGGVAPFFYQWNNGMTSSNIDSLCSGSYNLIVSDTNGCTSNDSVYISEPNSITISIDSLTNVSTYAGSDGSIEITVSGGAGNYSFEWFDDNGILATNEDISNLTAGSYYLTVTDANNCIKTDTFFVSQPNTILVSLQSVINPICNDSCTGSIDINVSGGNSNYSFSWSGPNNFISLDEDISNLCSGLYILTVSDGITSIVDSFNMFQPQPLTFDLIIDSITCFDQMTQATLLVFGGTQPFNYNWSNGDTNYYTFINSGLYSVNVTDNNGCELFSNFSLSNPDSLTLSSSTSNISCFGQNDGNATINVISGGTSPYQFSFDGVTFQQSNYFDGLVSGTYSIYILDSNNCIDSINFVISEPDELLSTISTSDASCFGECDGSALISTVGGTLPYIYSWSNDSTSLCAGNYNVITTDANNCITVDNFIINEPFPLEINIWLNGVDLQATSGFSSYQWFFENGNAIQGANSEIFSPQTAGIYYVIASDGFCEITSYSFNYDITNLSSISSSGNLYPNPTNGILFFEGNGSIKIYDQLGNELMKVDKINISTNLTKIDLSKFVKGIYNILVRQNNYTYRYKIVLQ